MRRSTAGVVLAIAGTVALGAIVSASVQAPTQVTLDWARQHSGMRAVALALAQDGSIYVTGPSLQDAQHDFREDIITIKYDQAGNQIWAQEFDETADATIGLDIPTWISLDPDGNVLVTGTSFLSGVGTNFVTLKYDPAGNLLWRAHSSVGRDAVRVAADAAGNVYVTGYTAGSGPNFVTLKYDPNGVQQWMQTYNGPNNFSDRARSLAVSPAGEVVVTGESTGGIPGFDAATIFYESDGTQRWLRRYNGAANGNDYGRDVVLGPSGEVYVGGQTATSGFSDALLIKYDSAGNQVWVRTFDGPSQKSDSFGRVALDSQGGVATAGFSQTANFTSDFLAARHDANGSLLWARTFNGPDNNEDIGFGLAVGLDDSIYVTGESFSKVGTVRYLPDGTLEWSQLYDNPGTLSDRGYSVAVDAQDNVVIAAQSPLLTLHYSQGGSGPLTVHVGDLDGTSARIGARWQATVTLTAHDGDHATLPGVTFTGHWSGDVAGSCTTGANGQCNIVSGLFNRTRTKVTFAATDASVGGYTYDPAANHDPDGDSNGTTITINRPGH